MATLYTQVSPEYQALCLQAYKLAELQLMAQYNSGALSSETGKKPAIVLDLDETVLDNSPFEAFCVLSGKSYPTGWDAWCNQASAKAVRGSEPFIRHADSIKIEIYFVTNRKEHLRM